jgi:hypothetical protein
MDGYFLGAKRVEGPSTPTCLNRGGHGVQSPADRLLEDGAPGREVRRRSRLSRSIRGSRRHKAFDFRSKMAEETGIRGVLGGESAAGFDAAMVRPLSLLSC